MGHFTLTSLPTFFLYMNAFGFFLHRLAWQFGYRRERARWGSVTRETQFLSEAQDLLGRIAWKQTGDLDPLTGEFWQLKDLDAQQEKLRSQSEQMLTRIDELKEKLDGIEDKYEEQIEELRDHKASVMETAAGIAAEMADIRYDDDATRERFGSLKGKLDVLKRQEGVDLSAEMERTRISLQELKQTHEASKKLIEAKEAEVRKVEASVQGVDGEIADKRAQMKEESAELVTEIGQLSKSVAETSAKIGTLETAKSELSFKVGVFLSDHADSRDPAIRKALTSCRPLVGKILALRKSISYNQRLARRTHG
jgi:chromosome segregation ATPase